MDSVSRRSPMPVAVEELWAWHTRPGALERLMPPWDRVRVVGRSGGIANGSTVTLLVPFGPARLRWTSEHRDVDPPHGFADTQISGPFAHWTHVHAMHADGPAASTLEDRIAFEGPARRGCPRCSAIATSCSPPISPRTPASPTGRG